MQPALLPEHRYQYKHEIGTVKFDALAIDAGKHLGDGIFIYRYIELDCLKPVILNILYTVNFASLPICFAVASAPVDQSSK